MEKMEDSALRTALTVWLAARIEGARDLLITDLSVARAAGFSATTMFFDAQWQGDGAAQSGRFVLRRQVVGHDLLHQPELSFQARVMNGLRGRPGLPIPRVIGDDDGALIGAPFLVMERLPGQIVPLSPNYNIGGWLHALPREGRRRIWQNSIRKIARVHQVDWRDGFSFMARGKAPGLAGYLDWIEDWMRWAVAGRAFPLGEAAIAWLKRHRPPDGRICVLWGDPSPTNMLYAQDGTITGLIDWELAALGPGEIDLAWWLMFDDLLSVDSRIARLEGLPGRDEMIALYEEETGRKVGDMKYYGVLVRLRMAILLMRGVDRQVNLGRYKADNTAWSHSPFAAAISRAIGIDPVEVSEDFFDFQRRTVAQAG